MLETLLSWLFDPSGLTPHGYCLTWKPGLIWLHAISDGLTGLAYLSIPVVLAFVMQRRKELIFRPIFWLFAGFILLCGTGHWLDVLTLWVPIYGFEGVIKAITAVASLVTAAVLWQSLPRILAFPSPAQMREAIAALEETNRQLIMAEEVAGIGSWRMTIPDQTLQLSREVAYISGREPRGQSVDLKTALSAFEPESHDRIQRKLEAAMQSGTEFDLEARIVRPNGDVRQVQCRGVPELKEDGSVTSVFGVMMDITERHEAEEVRGRLHDLTLQARDEAEKSNRDLQRLARHLKKARDAAEQANLAKSQFLSSMSHELRTPMNGVLGYAQLLRMEGGLTAAQLARVDAMMDAGSHLLDMINGVLDLSEIEADSVELRVSTTDIRELANSCLDLVRPSADAKHLSLCLTIGKFVPEQIAIDAIRVRQVIVNLLSNAVKFTHSGSIDLIIRVASAGERLRIEVRDTGSGIPDTERHRLFKPFERLNTESGSSIEGTGLGLALSAKLVGLMGGSIAQEENEGNGSIFWIELPLSVGKIDTPSGKREFEFDITKINAGGGAKLNVLVVDDVAMNREIVTAILQFAGHNVVCAENGQEAVEAALSRDFDVIMMDVRMPVMDGLEATRLIRSSGNPRAPVPIIAMTAQAFEDQRAACRAAGMSAHLSKPFTAKSLLAAIADAITPAETAAAPTPAAPEKPASDAPAFDHEMFSQTAAYLSPTAVVESLWQLAQTGEALLADLHEPHAIERNSTALANDAHKLAGSAGLFGFEQLRIAGRQFEHAMALSEDANDASKALSEAIKAAVLSVEQLANELAAGRAASAPEMGDAPG